jgi:hypothetical protein
MTISDADRAAVLLKANEPATQRTEAGLGTASTHAASDFLAAASNLSDVASASAARTSLSLGTAALLNLASPFLKVKVLAGGAAGNFTATGVKTTDALISVLRLVGAATTLTNITDLTGEFSITATNTINNTSGTATTSDKLLVVWVAAS